MLPLQKSNITKSFFFAISFASPLIGGCGLAKLMTAVEYFRRL